MARQKVAWLFTGHRDWPYELQPKLERSLDKLGVVMGPGGDLIIHGRAAGFDSAVEIWARRRGAMIAGLEYPNWKGRSIKAGGPLRNQQMVEIVQGLCGLGYKPRCVVGHSSMETLMVGRGTKDCYDRARRKGFPIKFIWGHYA